MASRLPAELLPAKLLIANRGEIAIRIARGAAELGVATVAVWSTDDATSLHTTKADEGVALPGSGAAAYLDVDAVVGAALATGCDAVHPGYGFLSENAAFARACAAAGLTFVGPTADVLDLFGDKVAARAAAERAGVAVLGASAGPVDATGAVAFLASLAGGAGLPAVGGGDGLGGAMVIKAVAGGGGRGMRVVAADATAAEVADAHARCVSEATAAFGNGAVYAEQYLAHARHIEVQVVGDGSGAVAHLGERDCSVQRRHQKLVEIAPAPGLHPAVRARIADAALTLARSVSYSNVGTFEFLLDAADAGPDEFFAFIEANPRLQVEHTVTEEVTGIDLVECQLRLAGGATLEELGLADGAGVAAGGVAIQVRVNLETMLPDGSAAPTGGMLRAFDMPSGRGVRVDTFGYAGYQTSGRYDSLLAKVITSRALPATGPAAELATFAAVAAKTHRALRECRIDGVETNVGFLQNILSHDDFVAARLSTAFIADHPELVAGPPSAPAPLHHRGSEPEGPAHVAGRVGAKVDSSDPLAVLAYGKAAGLSVAGTATAGATGTAPAGTAAAGTAAAGTVGSALVDLGQPVIAAPMQGTVVSLALAPGDTVRPGQVVAVMESMKMEHEVRAAIGGTVTSLLVAAGETLVAQTPLYTVAEGAVADDGETDEAEVDLDVLRPDLAEVTERHRITLDEARPDAVARRRKTGQRTARENVADLCDPDTFVEYGALVVAAQRRRRSMEDLIKRSPADGMITGVGQVNGSLFGDPASRCAVLAYDYTVFAGTQGIKNHHKTDRLIAVAQEARLPLVLFAEGGGGRPGDTDGGDHGTWTFAHFARLSGLVPMVGITSGRCYAGNASLLGCCDVIIATANSNIGMGGPAMIEGGGLGVYAPEEIGPMEVQTRSGVVDIAVADEAEAVSVAKQYLGYFQGRLPTWTAPDQREMRAIVPENRLRVYEVRRVIDTLADVGSVLELRRDFGVGIITALVRVEGRPLGIVANNPAHLGGAIDSDGADKGARFMQLCDAFDIPLLFLCDTPGIMVGPEVEKTALVRHSSRMFLIGANVSVPSFCVVLRKAYGLGCIAMAAASFKAPQFSVAWPTGEFGGMGLEGSVKLGFRDELAALEDPAERLALYNKLVEREYQRGKALNYASGFAIDDTIDPADTRFWLANLLAAQKPPPAREGKKRMAVDAW